MDLFVENNFVSKEKTTTLLTYESRGVNSSNHGTGTLHLGDDTSQLSVVHNSQQNL